MTTAGDERAGYSLRVNGEPHPCGVEGDTPLLWVLRDHLDLTGTKYGCGIGRCGACTVLVDGVPIRSCVTPLRRVEGEVTTIEARDEKLCEVQEKWIEHNVPQCGYCQSGQVMAAFALLKARGHPTDEEIDLAMSGNLCRCGTYPRIRAAIRELAGRSGPDGSRTSRG